MVRCACVGLGFANTAMLLMNLDGFGTEVQQMRNYIVLRQPK